jgi:hypothetical protein
VTGKIGKFKKKKKHSMTSSEIEQTCSIAPQPSAKLNSYFVTTIQQLILQVLHARQNASALQYEGHGQNDSKSRL